MRLFTTCLLFFCASWMAVAEDLMSMRDGFLQTCSEQGTEDRYCACFFDNWAPDVPGDDIKGAVIAVDLFAGRVPENSDDISLAATPLAELQNTMTKCVSGELIPLDDKPKLPPIEQTHDQAELDQLAERLQSGQGTLEEMMRHDALAMDLRAQARAEEEAAEAARDQRALENKAALRAEYDRQLDRIHRREIEAWEVADFETLFGLYCQMDGGRPEECACGWPIALRWANGRQNFVYLASRDPGDDVTERVPLTIMQAISNSALPTMRRQIAEACFQD